MASNDTGGYSEMALISGVGEMMKVLGNDWCVVWRDECMVVRCSSGLGIIMEWRLLDVIIVMLVTN